MKRGKGRGLNCIGLSEAKPRLSFSARAEKPD